VLSDVKAGRIKEVFGCGTAAVVSPVRALLDQGEEYIVGQGTPGPVTLQLKAELESVQNGSGPDPLGWRTKIS
jgi:branched-chain amino acid aminotransferase